MSSRSNLRLVGTATQHPNCPSSAPKVIDSRMPSMMARRCLAFTALLQKLGNLWEKAGATLGVGWVFLPLKCLWKVGMTLQTPRFFQRESQHPTNLNNKISTQFSKICSWNFWVFSKHFPQFLEGWKFQNDIRNHHQVYQFDPPTLRRSESQFPHPVIV